MERLLATVQGASPDAELVYLKASPDGELLVSIVNGGSGNSSTVDREPIITKYKVITAFAGASVGDRIIHTRWIDVDGTTPSTWAEEWYNDSTRLALASAPLNANLGDTSAGGSADSTAANQITQIARATEVRDSIGLPADAVASTDAGTFSLIALMKRSLGQWTSLISLLPTALVGGRFGVDVKESTGAPITGQSIPSGGVGITGWLSAIFGKLQVFSLGAGAVDASTPRVALATGQTFSLSSTNTVVLHRRIACSSTASSGLALSSATTKIGVFASTGNIRLAVGASSAVAATTGTSAGIHSVLIPVGAYREFTCATGSYVSAVNDQGAATANVFLELTELA